MKKRSIQIGLAALVFTLAQLACNFPAGGSSATPQPEAAASPTVEEAAPAACAALATLPQPSGFISRVTLAQDAAEDDRAPINPTTLFPTSATFHAVVSLANAPADTRLRAAWFAADTSGAAECNTQIDAYELSTDGSRNIDFNLTPTDVWPAGTYRVEISVNGVLDQVIFFSVK